MNITKEQIQLLKESYEINKEDLRNLEKFIDEHGMTNDGLSDVTESFEQGYNNALEWVFKVLHIDCK